MARRRGEPARSRGRETTEDARDPASVLRAVAYRLETEGAPTYKVRAFRNAADVATAVGSEHLAELDRAGRLTSLSGIGATTAAVIHETLERGRADYLEALEARTEAALPPSAAALRAALRGDCHSHSDWSDGSASIEEMAGSARDLGHEYLVLTDHSPRLTIAHGLDADRLVAQLGVVAELNARLAPFRLLTGIEVDILDNGDLDQDPELLAQLDVVVASVHSKLRMARAAMTARMVRAVENPLVDILGHATGRLVGERERPESDFEHAAVFGACARAGVAVEVNSRPDRRDPRRELLTIALAEGCLLSIDSDAHAPGQLEWLDNGCVLAAAAGAAPSDLLNACPATELLARTRPDSAT